MSEQTPETTPDQTPARNPAPTPAPTAAHIPTQTPAQKPTPTPAQTPAQIPTPPTAQTRAPTPAQIPEHPTAQTPGHSDSTHRTRPRAHPRPPGARSGALPNALSGALPSALSGALRDGARREATDDRYVGGVDLTHWYTPLGRAIARLVGEIGRRLGPNAALVITLIVGGIVAVALSAVAAQVYDSVTDADGVAGLDQPFLDAAIALRSPALDSIATGYTDIAGTVGMPVIAVAVLVLLALRRRSFTPVILIVAAGTGSLLMTIAGKNLIGRTRPDLTDAVPPYEHSPSFPSGHTLNATVIAGIIAYLLIVRQHSVAVRTLTIVVASLFALTVGISRVFLGHHWLTDVIAGWALGGAWLAIVITAHRLYLTTRGREETAAP